MTKGPCAEHPREHRGCALQSRRLAWGVCLAALLTATVSTANPPSTSSGPRVVVGMTTAFESATLASVQPARIESINIPEGGLVRRGAIVVQLDERSQAARTAMAKANAETGLNVEYARVRWERAKRDLDRLQKLHGSDFASTKEMSDAIADEQISRVEYDLAHFNQSQAVTAHEREAALLEDFRLRAPFDGYVTAHLKHAGEAVNVLEGVVTLAQLDPLKVVLDCPVEMLSTIEAGSRYWVRPTDERFPKRIGTVLFANRAVDGGSQTLRVKLTVENGDGAWPAGLKVHVDFSEPAPATASTAAGDE